MDIGGDCGKVRLVLVMVTTVAKLAALIRGKLFNCMFGVVFLVFLVFVVVFVV